ncbi:MAG: YicC family protein [Armatimonadetes bacterium]|nr:YicC family protein [Armatimonadota bacterium]
MPIRSMTGYGTGEAQTLAGRFVVEVRSVNHRFADVVVRLPRDLSPLEERVRAAVQGRVQRGRVEITVIREERGRRAKAIRADIEMAQAYARVIEELARSLNVEASIDLRMLAGFPDVIRLEEDKPDIETLWPPLEAALGGALVTFIAMREEEGRRLAEDLLRRAGTLSVLAEEVAGRSPAVVEEYTARLGARVKELLGDVPLDEARLATEAVFFAERSDISEEITRLRSHLAQFQDTIRSADGAVGRKLEFLLQELGREVNTVGSKANDLIITRAVITMKSELESLREQVQNIE